MDRYILGGRAFVHVGESTVEHDLHFLALKAQARLDSAAMAEGESYAAYAERLLDEILASGRVLPILGCLLVPEPTDGKPPGDSWTPELAKETEDFLRTLKAPADKALIHGLITTVLIDFFQSGLVSLKTSATSSSASASPKGLDPEPVMAAGQS